MLTLTRASWRAFPRGLTQTVIGNPVVLGNRFAISKRSSVSSASALSEPIFFAFTTSLRRSLAGFYPDHRELQSRIPQHNDSRAKPALAKTLPIALDCRQRTQLEGNAPCITSASRPIAIS